jgi:CBS domain containing-hemolysin-like protein
MEESNSRSGKISRKLLISELSKIEVSEIMIPRSSVVLINMASPFEEILDIIIKDGHSRFPVYSEKIDNIIGVLYSKSLLSVLKSDSQKDFKISKILKKPLFVSENKKAGELLTMFKNIHIHMAIVVNEYGAMLGIITMEDILEEIVGEINDEFDKEEASFYTVISDKETSIIPRMSIEEFNKVFKTRIRSEEYDTIGGFVIDWFGYVPKAGENFEYGNYNFLIQSAEGSRIKKITIQKL